MLNGNEMFLMQLDSRDNGKCAIERELLKKAKLIKYLKKELCIMSDDSYKELYRVDKEIDKSYIRGYQDALNKIMLIIYEGEHKNEN